MPSALPTSLNLYFGIAPNLNFRFSKFSSEKSGASSGAHNPQTPFSRPPELLVKLDNDGFESDFVGAMGLWILAQHIGREFMLTVRTWDVAMTKVMLIRGDLVVAS